MESAFKSVQANKGSADEQAMAKDFIDRVSDGKALSGVSRDDLKGSIKLLQGLPPTEINDALNASVKNIRETASPAVRSSLDTMLKQRKAGEGLIDITRAGQNTKSSGDSGGNTGLGGILGGLLGGLLGGGKKKPQSPGLDDILGDIFGPSSGGSSKADDDGFLASLLENPVVSALLVGAAATVVKRILA